MAGSVAGKRQYSRQARPVQGPCRVLPSVSPIIREQARALGWRSLSVILIDDHLPIFDGHRIARAVIHVNGVTTRALVCPDRKSTDLNSTHYCAARMPSSA